MGRIRVLKAGVFAVFAVMVLAGPRAAAATPRASDEPVVAVVTFAGLDRLRQDLDLIGNLGELPGLRSMFDGAVAVQTGGRGMDGIDPARPWGAIVLGREPRTLVLVPCLDLNSLIETMAKLPGGRWNDLGDGSFEIQTPRRSYFIRQSGHYAYFAMTAEELDDLPTNPDTFFDGLYKSYDIAARIYWQAIPAEAREQVIEQIRTSFGRHLNDPFTGGTATAEASLERAITWLERTDTITYGWSLDEATQKVSGELTWRAVEGRHLEQIAHYLHAEPTRFAGFAGPAASMTLNVSLGPLTSDDALCLRDALEQFKQYVATSPSSDSTEEQRAEQNAIDDIADVLLQTATEDGIDLAVGVFKKEKSHQATTVFAAEIADGERMERALERLAAIEDFPDIEWDYSTAGDIRWHRMATENAKYTFGFGPRELYIAIGNQGEAALPRALQLSKQTPTSPMPPVQLSVSMNDAIQHASEDRKHDAWHLWNANWQDFPMQDHLTLSLQPVDRGVRIRAELEKGIVAWISRAIGLGFKRRLTSADR